MTAVSYTIVQSFAINELKRAQKLFNKHPNAQNWTLTLAAMLVHQQAEQLGRPGNAELRNDLMGRLNDGMPFDLWPEAIVRTMSGQSIGEILAKH